MADCVAHAFMEADVEAIIILVECGGNLVHTFMEDGHLNKVNALVRAAEFDKVEALKTMLSINKSLINSTSLDIRSSSSLHKVETPLTTAIKKRHMRCVDLLLDEGAFLPPPPMELNKDTHLNKVLYNSVLDVAISCKSEEAIEKLVRIYIEVGVGVPMGSLCKSFVHRNPKITKTLLSGRAETSIINPNTGMVHSALLEVIWPIMNPPFLIDKTYGEGDRETVKCLLDAGSVIDEKATRMDFTDLETSIKYPCSPLYLAAAYGYLEIVELLVQRGAQVNLEHREDGQTFTPVTKAEWTYQKLQEKKHPIFKPLASEYYDQLLRRMSAIVDILRSAAGSQNQTEKSHEDRY